MSQIYCTAAPEVLYLYENVPLPLPNFKEHNGYYFDYSSDGLYKRSDTYNYVYSDNGLPLQKVHFFRIYEKNSSNKLKKDENWIKVNHSVYIYDEHDNLSKEIIYCYKLPSDADFSDAKMETADLTRIFNHFNIYDNEGRLTCVIDESINKRFMFTYENGVKVQSEVHEYSECRLSHKIKYIYEDDFLCREEYYYPIGVLMKIINYKKIGDRVSKKITSPANDGFCWYLEEFRGGSASLIVEEDLLTPQIMQSIYGYIIVNMNLNEGFSIYFDRGYVMPALLKEVYEIIEKYRIEYEIDLVQTF